MPQLLPKLLITLLAGVLLIASLSVPQINILAVKRRLLLQDSRLLLPADYRLLLALNQYAVTTGTGVELEWANQQGSAPDLSPEEISQAEFEFRLIDGQNIVGTYKHNQFNSLTKISVFDEELGKLVPTKLSNFLTIANYYTKYKRGISTVNIRERLVLDRPEIAEIIFVVQEYE